MPNINLQEFFKKEKLERELSNIKKGFNLEKEFKQDIIPKTKSIVKGIIDIAKSPFQIVEKKPERFTFETEEDFIERERNLRPFKDKGLPETKASQFIKSAGARLPEELIKGGAKAIQTLGKLGKIGFGKDISETTQVPKQLQRFIGNEKELKSYYVEYADCVDKGGNPFVCSAKNASKFALDLSIVMDFALAGIKSGIKALPINKTIEEVGHKASFIQLGRPKTIEQAEINYKNILRNVSPLSSKANRLGTVNVEASKEAKNAFDLLKAKGIPNTSKLGEFLGRLEKPFKIKEFFKEAKKLRETGFISPKGLITEQAGTIPTELFKPKTPSFGLSIRDIKAKPIAKEATGKFYINELDAKGNFAFVPAEKAKPIDISPIIKTFISKGKVSGWRISEVRTGRLIVESKTQKEAIEKAGQIIEKNKDNIEIAINKAVEKGGISPRFKTSFAPKTELSSSISKAKASGQSFDEWMKGQMRLQGEIQKQKTGRALTFNDFNKDGTREFLYPDDFTIGGKTYRISTSMPGVAKGSTRGTLPSIWLDREKIGTIGTDGLTKSHLNKIIEAIKTRSQLKAEWDKIKPRQMKTSAEIPSLEKAWEGGITEKTIVPTKPALKLSPKLIDKLLKPPLAPSITRTARESTLLKEKLKAQEISARRGARAGVKVEKQAQEAIRVRELEDLRRKKDLSLLKQRIKDRFTFIEKGLRKGQIKQKTVTKIVQEELIDIIKGIVPLEERGKFLITIKNIQTPEQLQKAMPDIKRRISEILDRRETKTNKTQIQKELKEKTIRRDPSGVRVGKVMPEAQRELDNIKETLKLTQEKALEKLENITSGLNEMSVISDSLQEQIRLLQRFFLTSYSP